MTFLRANLKTHSTSTTSLHRKSSSSIGRRKFGALAATATIVALGVTGLVAAPAQAAGGNQAASTVPSALRSADTLTPLTSLVVPPIGKGTRSISLGTVPAGATAVTLKLSAAGAWQSTVLSASIGGNEKTAVLKVAKGETPSTATVTLPIPANHDGKLTLSSTRASVRLATSVVDFTAPEAVGTAPEPVGTAPAPDPAAAPSAVPGLDAGAGNTGIPAGTALTVHQGDLVITEPGTVIDSLDIHGTVSVRADDVTIKNSVVRGKSSLSYTTALISNTKGNTGLNIVDTELIPTEASPYAQGIVGADFTATRLNIHGVIDSVHLTGGNVTLENSWLHDNLHYEVSPWGDASHDDSIQIQAGSNIRIVGNNVSGAKNSGVQITQDAGIVSDVAFEGNMLDGGGCTINIAEKGEGAIQGIVITNNFFGRTTKHVDCAVISPSTTTPTLSENYYIDDNALVTVHGG